MQTDKKYHEPTSKSYRIVRDAVQDPLIPAKMAAFESVSSQLQPFLALFQSDNPLLPFMVSTLQKIIEGLMKRFIKSDVLHKATSAVKLLQVDLSDKKNYLEMKKVDTGFVADNKLKKVQADKQASDRQVRLFTKLCFVFIVRNQHTNYWKTLKSWELGKILKIFCVSSPGNYDGPKGRGLWRALGLRRTVKPSVVTL